MEARQQRPHRVVRVSTQPGDRAVCSICGRPARGEWVVRKGRKVFIRRHVSERGN